MENKQFIGVYLWEFNSIFICFCVFGSYTQAFALGFNVFWGFRLKDSSMCKDQ